MRSSVIRPTLRFAAVLFVASAFAACASGEGTFAPPECEPRTTTPPTTPTEPGQPPGRDSSQSPSQPESPPNSCTPANA